MQLREKQTMIYTGLKVLGTKTAAEMLAIADETHLISQHFVQGKHFGSLPAGTPVQVFSRSVYSRDFSSSGTNTEFGCRYAESGQEIPTTLGYTDEFRLEFPGNGKGIAYDSQQILEANWE